MKEKLTSTTNKIAAPLSNDSNNQLSHFMHSKRLFYIFFIIGVRTLSYILYFFITFFKFDQIFISKYTVWFRNININAFNCHFRQSFKRLDILAPIVLGIALESYICESSEANQKRVMNMNIVKELKLMEKLYCHIFALFLLR